MKNKIILMVFLLFMVPLACAHQPRIAFGYNSSFENPIHVDKPEISKAYYGELKGSPDYYMIESADNFTLYLNILAPDLEDSRTDFIVEVLSDNETIYLLNGTSYEWNIFFEEFARDSYLEGPELETEVEKGAYHIKVYNEDNIGKYSLAIGKIESFPPEEIIKTAVYLPRIKKEFFEKPAITAFLNPIGLFILFILLVIAIVFLIIKSIFKKKKVRISKKRK